VRNQDFYDRIQRAFVRWPNSPQQSHCPATAELKDRFQLDHRFRPREYSLELQRVSRNQCGRSFSCRNNQ